MEKVNISEFLEFSEERFTKRIVFKKNESVTFILNFNAGQSLPKHKHPGTDLYLYVLEGSGLLNIDGQDNQINKGDIIHCDGEEEFSFQNNSTEQVSLYVTLTKIPSELYSQNI
ncbi:MAG: cupin protein [Bacillales bacterium]|jgi:quercetin dioxygenase-like cupin family protein|nr:cupin protein [Bacillales bacterium]